MSVTVKKQKWTYEDYLRIEDNNRYDIYRGELIMVPAPSSGHQRYSRNIGFFMWSYVKEKGPGEALYAPLDVIFAEDDVYQPDIVYVSKENVNIIKENGIFGAPDLIVEIISPGTAIYDVVDKREIYEGYGVKELWFVNPDEKAVEVLVLKDGVYKRHSFARKKGEVCSQIIEGFKADLKDVFCIDK